MNNVEIKYILNEIKKCEGELKNTIIISKVIRLKYKNKTIKLFIWKNEIFKYNQHFANVPNLEMSTNDTFCIFILEYAFLILYLTTPYQHKWCQTNRYHLKKHKTPNFIGSSIPRISWFCLQIISNLYHPQSFKSQIKESTLFVFFYIRFWTNIVNFYNIKYNKSGQMPDEWSCKKYSFLWFTSKLLSKKSLEWR